MRAIHLARVDKMRPVLLMTREPARNAMRKITVIPITSTVKGLMSEVLVGPANGLDHGCALACDNITTIDKTLLGRHLGYLLAHQERELTRALHDAYDLEDL